MNLGSSTLHSEREEAGRRRREYITCARVVPVKHAFFFLSEINQSKGGREGERRAKEIMLKKTQGLLVALKS